MLHGTTIPRDGTPTTPPAVAQTTVFGANIGPVPPFTQSHSQAVQEHMDLCGGLPIFRSFMQGIPATWANSGDDTLYGTGANSWQNRWSYVSFKPGVLALEAGTQHQKIVNYVESIPVTGRKRILTAHHEPENDGKSLTAANYKNAYYNFSQSVRSVGHPDVLSGPTFMAKYNLLTSGAGWSTDQIVTANTGTDLGDVVDFIGWDPYFESGIAGNFNPASDAEAFFKPLRDYTTAQFGADMPIAFAETGTNNNDQSSFGFAPLQYRPWAMLQMESWCLANNVLLCCYFDNNPSQTNEDPIWLRIHTTESGQDGWPSAPYPADTASINTWAGVYARNPLLPLAP